VNITAHATVIGEFDLNMICTFLKPGEFHITSKSVVPETLVGSCVCVCMYNIKNGWAATNHFLRDRPTGDVDGRARGE